MTFIEFLTFIITLLLFVYLSARQMWQDRRNNAQRGGEGYDKDDLSQEDSVREIMRALNLSDDDVADYERAMQSQQDAEQHKKPPPPPVIKTAKAHQAKRKSTSTFNGQYEFSSELEDYRSKSMIEKRRLETELSKRYQGPSKPVVSETFVGGSLISPYAIGVENRTSRGKKLLNQLNSKKDAVILHEIIGKPRAFQDYEVGS